MPTRILRSEATEWKKKSLRSLREIISALKGARRDVDGMLGSTKNAVAQIGQEAAKIAKSYDRNLNDGDDDYDRDSGTMDALRDVPDAGDQADDAKAQISEALDGLISHLEEIRDAIGEITP